MLSGLGGFEITDLDLEFRTGPLVNWTHGNALDFDADGNLVVWFRSLSEITKIDTKTGAVLWRMGGLRNQFAFPDSSPPFLRQHGVRIVNGEIVLLDNLWRGSRKSGGAIRLDEAVGTARLAQAHVPSSAVRATLGGTTQSLPNGHTPVAFGDGGAVQEFDGDRVVVWRIEGNAGYVFRAQRIQSLYHSEIGLVR